MALVCCFSSAMTAALEYANYVISRQTSPIARRKMAAPMKTKCILCTQNTFKHIVSRQSVARNVSTSKANSFRRKEEDFDEKKDSQGFRRYRLRKIESRTDFARRKYVEAKQLEPRYTRMPVDQDWTKVWPTAQTFKWSVVPLPIKQGALKNLQEAKGDGLPPGKKGNTELIKIPNFLHLTPKHIEKHCNAIKKFCTKWPEELNKEAAMDYHFPLEVITSDYCFSSPSVRDPRARTVTFKFKASELEMDDHAKDKWQRLIKTRNDDISLTADRCPTRQQNYDYLQYLLTALYFESWKVEAWESEITPDDLLDYSWEYSESKTNTVKLLNLYREKDQASGGKDKKLPYVTVEVKPDTVTTLEPVKEYKSSVEELYRTGENITTLNNYKQSVLKMLNVKSKSAHS